MQTADRREAPGVSPTPFPLLAALRIQIPIASKEWTIWPAPPETRQEYVIGFPLELRPFAWNYVRLSSDGLRIELQPHYRESTFDTFWVDGRGHVTCHAMAGVFPFTLGRQPELLQGLSVTLKAMPALVATRDQSAAHTIGVIADRVGAIALELQQHPEADLRREIDDARTRARATWRGRQAENFWLAKLERSRRRAGILGS